MRTIAKRVLQNQIHSKGSKGCEPLFLFIFYVSGGGDSGASFEYFADGTININVMINEKLQEVMERDGVQCARPGEN